MIQTRERLILYVDDTEEQRYVMRRILEGAGYRVLEAGTGREGLDKLSPNVLAVVLDVKLPDMSGFEVCRRIKADPATAAIPVLQISASFADPTLRAAGLSGGADAYVAQPVHPAELLALVNALIRSHESEKTLRFQAEVSGRLSLSLEHDETLHAIEHVFTPRFADRCFALLVADKTHARDVPEPIFETPGLAPELRTTALEVTTSGLSQMVEGRALVVPLEVGRKRMGALVFLLHGTERVYARLNLPLAEDLADRAALALQNANLYTAQRAAQQALIQSEKLAAAGRLSAAIAHEINNPLESITNLLYLIETAEETPPSIRGYVQEALSELSRLTHIARQSLGFYRELTGPATFDLNESIEDTLQIYLKRFESKRIQVRRSYSEGPLELSAVKGEVRQVVSNLLVNAYDAMADGGTLTIATRRVQECVQFAVADNGSGIAHDVIGRIFEPFFTTKDGTGTGLGLWVSDTIVTNHGGTIEVSSATSGPASGSIFEVSLPILAKLA